MSQLHVGQRASDIIALLLGASIQSLLLGYDILQKSSYPMVINAILVYRQHTGTNIFHFRTSKRNALAIGASRTVSSFLHYRHD